MENKAEDQNPELSLDNLNPNDDDLNLKKRMSQLQIENKVVKPQLVAQTSDSPMEA